MSSFDSSQSTEVLDAESTEQEEGALWLGQFRLRESVCFGPRMLRMNMPVLRLQDLVCLIYKFLE